MNFLNALAWITAALITAVINLPSLLIVLPFSFFLDRDRLALHTLAKFWANCLLACHPAWKLIRGGLKNFSRKQNYVVVANHQSMLDILVVLAGLPLHFKFIAKKELFTIPFLGWHMWAAGYIGLERGNTKSGKEAVETARNWLNKKVSVLLFPEGTRSEDGEIHAFKNGAFKLAMEAGVPLLPVVLDGTGATSPKKSRTVSKAAKLQMQICKPVTPGPGDTLESLKEKVRSTMAAKLAEMRA